MTVIYPQLTLVSAQESLVFASYNCAQLSIAGRPEASSSHETHGSALGPKHLLVSGPKLLRLAKFPTLVWLA
jgi:hypothetical protein